MVTDEKELLQLSLPLYHAKYLVKQWSAIKKTPGQPLGSVSFEPGRFQLKPWLGSLAVHADVLIRHGSVSFG